jgi:hypothetical protein
MPSLPELGSFAEGSSEGDWAVSPGTFLVWAGSRGGKLHVEATNTKNATPKSLRERMAFLLATENIEPGPGSKAKPDPTRSLGNMESIVKLVMPERM